MVSILLCEISSASDPYISMPSSQPMTCPIRLMNMRVCKQSRRGRSMQRDAAPSYLAGTCLFTIIDRSVIFTCVDHVIIMELAILITRAKKFLFIDVFADNLSRARSELTSVDRLKFEQSAVRLERGLEPLKKKRRSGSTSPTVHDGDEEVTP